MALICDTSDVYALYDANDSEHAAVTAVVESEPEALLLPVILLAEIDYLFYLRLGPDAALEFIEAVEQGDFALVRSPARISCAVASWWSSIAT